MKEPWLRMGRRARVCYFVMDITLLLHTCRAACSKRSWASRIGCIPTCGEPSNVPSCRIRQVGLSLRANQSSHCIDTNAFSCTKGRGISYPRMQTRTRCSATYDRGGLIHTPQCYCTPSWDGECTARQHSCRCKTSDLPSCDKVKMLGKVWGCKGRPSMTADSALAKAKVLR